MRTVQLGKFLGFLDKNCIWHDQNLRPVRQNVPKVSFDMANDDDDDDVVVDGILMLFFPLVYKASGQVAIDAWHCMSGRTE